MAKRNPRALARYGTQLCEVNLRHASKLPLAFVLASLILSGVWAQTPEDFQLVDKALKIQVEDAYKSSQLLQEIAQKSPAWDYPQILLGELYDKYHLVSKAAAAFETALGLLKQDALRQELYYRLSMNYLKMGDSEKAKAYISKINTNEVASEKKKDITSAAVLIEDFILAEAYVKNKDRRAEPLLNRIIAQQDKLFAAYSLLGEYYESKGRKESAVKTYEAALLFPTVKNIVFAGLSNTESSGVYKMIPDAAQPGRWSLTLQIPRGEYEYRFIQNYQFPDENSIPDPLKSEVFKGDKGLLYNKIQIESSLETVSFSYQTLEQDKIFDYFQLRVAALRSKALTKNYPKTLFNTSENGVLVNFKYYDPKAYAVWAVGSFNRFGLNVSESNALDPTYYWPLKGPDKEGYWNLAVRVPAGEFFYNYVVNETSTVKDPLLLGRLDYTRQQASSIKTKPRKAPEELVTDLTLKGYKANDSEVTFTYDPAVFGTKPVRVLLAGSFNSWITFKSDAKTVKQWTLSSDETTGLWFLKVPLSQIPPNAEFKYIIDDDNWQVPPNGLSALYLSDDKTNQKVYLRPSTEKQTPKTISVKPFSLWGQFSRLAVGDLQDIVLTYSNVTARSVRIAGDFNDWGKYYKTLIADYNLTSPDRDGNWRVTLRLPIGSYEYKYVVDGYVWVIDPAFKSRRSENSEIIVR